MDNKRDNLIGNSLFGLIVMGIGVMISVIYIMVGAHNFGFGITFAEEILLAIDATLILGLTSIVATWLVVTAMEEYFKADKQGR